MTGHFTVDACFACGRTVLMANPRKRPADSQVNRCESVGDSVGRAILPYYIETLMAETDYETRMYFEDLIIELSYVLGKFLFQPSLLRANELRKSGEGEWTLVAKELSIRFRGVSCSGTISSAQNARRLVLPKHAEDNIVEVEPLRSALGHEIDIDIDERRALVDGGF